MLLSCGAREDSWVPWTARKSNQSILNKISPEYSLEGLMLKLKLQCFGHLMQRTNLLEKPWFWERLRAGGKGGDRGWDGWMASLTQWTWVWANTKRKWRAWKLGVLPWGHKELDMAERLNNKCFWLPSHITLPLKTFIVKQNLQSWFLDTNLSSPQVVNLMNKAHSSFKPTLSLEYWLSSREQPNCNSKLLVRLPSPTLTSKETIVVSSERASSMFVAELAFKRGSVLISTAR